MIVVLARKIHGSHVEVKRKKRYPRAEDRLPHSRMAFKRAEDGQAYGTLGTTCPLTGNGSSKPYSAVVLPMYFKKQLFDILEPISAGISPTWLF